MLEFDYQKVNCNLCIKVYLVLRFWYENKKFTFFVCEPKKIDMIFISFLFLFTYYFDGLN
jgi:hypothetical protein